MPRKPTSVSGALDKSLVTEMSKAYAQLLDNLCSKWVPQNDFLDDHPYDFLQSEKSEEVGKSGIQLVIQPSKKKDQMGDLTKCSAFILLPAGTKVSSATEKEFEREVDKINQLFVSQFWEMMEESGQRFQFKIPGKVTFPKILRLIKPLAKVRSTLWKLSFKPYQTYPDFSGKGVWYPWKVRALYNPSGVKEGQKRNKEICEYWKRHGNHLALENYI